MDREADGIGGTALGLALAGAAVLALASPVQAEAQTPVQTQPPAARPQPPRPAPKPPAAEDATEVSEIVVTVTSPTVYATQPGAALGGLAPELQIGPLDIQSYGVSSVSQLLDELAIQTNSTRGRGGESPVVLLNGKRISGMGEVRDIPTEAILRVDILPEETALSYGFTADQKVVNIVLRPRFRSLTGEGTVSTPTAGGQVNGSADGNSFRVLRDDRLNIDVKVSGNTDLTYASRGLSTPSVGAPYALGGNITAASGFGPIDSALTAVAGRPLTVVGVPASLATATPTLAAFAAAPVNVDDLGRYRDLSGAAQSLSANVVGARALGNQWTATLNATLSTSASQSLQGLPSLTLILPTPYIAGVPVLLPTNNHYSPFFTAVALDRYVDALGPLKQTNVTSSGHLGLTINKQAGRWRFSITGAYDHSDNLTETGMGVNAAPLQALLDAGSPSFNPFGPLSASQLTRLPNSEARSISDGGNIQGLVNGPLLKVPAGNLNVSLKFGDSQSGFISASQRLGVTQSVSLSRNDLNGQLNLDLPLASKRNNFFPQLGELSVNVNTNFDQLSDFGVIHSLGYGLNWTPIPQVRLIVSRTSDQAAPSVSQLGSPTVITPQVRYFDYATGQTVDVTQISGSNRALIGDNRNVFKAGATIRPWVDKQFSININYTDQRIDNPISGFPSATAQVQAAFPDRFLRDASGSLIEVDQRPVNLDWTSRRSLRWGFNWTTPFGKPPPRPQIPPGALDALRRARQGGQGAPPNGPGAQGPGGQGQGPAAPGPVGDRAGPPPVPGQVAGGPGGPPPGFGGFPGGGGPGGPGGAGGFGGFGGGGGGGRGGGGGPGGGGGGAPGQGRLEVAVFDTVYFTDQTLVRPSGPLLDLLNGAPAGGKGGQPINAIDGQLGVTKGGLGARINATWVQGTTVQGGSLSPSGTLTFSDLTTIHLRLFANFGQIPQIARKHPFLRGARLTVSVFNVFDQRLHVRDATGLTPLGDQPSFLDPTGRQVAISFRRLFF